MLSGFPGFKSRLPFLLAVGPPHMLSSAWCLLSWTAEDSTLNWFSHLCSGKEPQAAAPQPLLSFDPHMPPQPVRSLAPCTQKPGKWGTSMPRAPGADSQYSNTYPSPWCRLSGRAHVKPRLRLIVFEKLQ